MNSLAKQHLFAGLVGLALAAIAPTLIVIELAHALHLGPIVLGEERTETTLFCYSLEDVKTVVEIDTKYLDQPRYVFLESFHKWNITADGNQKCPFGPVTYIATVKSFEYEGRYEMGTGVWSVYGALTTIGGEQVTIYVFVLNPPTE